MRCHVQRITMEFSWGDNMQMVCFNGPQILRPAQGGTSNENRLYFGPHRQIVETTTGGSDQERKEALELEGQMKSGFTRMYLFTWLDENAAPEETPPDVSIADLWIE